MIPPMFPISDENERGHGPAYVSLAFIALNVLVFLFLQGAGGSAEGARFTYGYSAVPYEITNQVDLTEDQSITIEGQQVPIPQEPGPSPIWLTLFTSMFMHGGWLHLGGNMLFLWIFGDNIEDTLGHLRYIIFYLVCGLIASLAHVFTTIGFHGAGSEQALIPSLGASGAISGVLGGYLLLHPHRRVTVIMFRLITQVPAYVAIGLWFLFQIISSLGAFGEGSQAGGVAYAAHIGGFIAGLLLIKVFATGRDTDHYVGRWVQR